MSKATAAFARVSAAILILAACAPSWAAVVRLSDLTQAGATLPVGDKVFDHFTISLTGTDTSGIDLSNIQVLPLTTGDLGIRFQPITGTTILTVGADNYADLLIGFQVHVTDPSKHVTGVNLAFGATAPSDGLASVTEDAYNGTTQLGHLLVSTLTNTYTDQATTGAYRDLEINKDIAVWGGSSEAASISYIEQRFPQMPEPAAVTLLALGGLLMLRGRKGRVLGRSVLAIMLLAGTAQIATPAHAATLNTLTTGGTLTSTDGRFQFSNFSVDPISRSGRTAGSASTIDVSPFAVAGEQGLRFSGLVATLGSSSLEMTVHYTVTALTAGEQIDSSFIRFNGALSGSPASSTVQSLIKNGSTQVGSGTISAASLAQLSLTIPLSGIFSTVDVTDTINLSSGTGASANLSYIDQVFTAMPEPAAGLLLAFGLLALTRRRPI